MSTNAKIKPDSAMVSSPAQKKAKMDDSKYVPELLAEKDNLDSSFTPLIFIDQWFTHAMELISAAKTPESKMDAVEPPAAAEAETTTEEPKVPEEEAKVPEEPKAEEAPKAEAEPKAPEEAEVIPEAAAEPAPGTEPEPTPDLPVREMDPGVEETPAAAAPVPVDSTPPPAAGDSSTVTVEELLQRENYIKVTERQEEEIKDLEKRFQKKEEDLIHKHKDTFKAQEQNEKLQGDLNTLWEDQCNQLKKKKDARLAKGGCYGLTATPPWSTSPAMHFPLFGGRRLAMSDKECD